MQKIHFMRFSFPLFSSHLDLAHQFWKNLLQKDDVAVDATCGNGKDTLKLAHILKDKGGGRLVGLDIQQKALAETQKLMLQECPDFVSSTTLLHLSHEDFSKVPLLAEPKLIVYNLGYLPGGDKSITSRAETTLKSLTSALGIIANGGAISLTCYPGHAEGQNEYLSLLPHLENLPPDLWSVTILNWYNRKNSPILILLQKKS